MRQVFFEKSIEESFLRDGFVLIPDFIARESIEYLSDKFKNFDTGFQQGFHVTNWSKETDYRVKSHLEVTDVLLPAINKLAVDYKPVLGCFAVKYPGSESEMGIHQDWSLVDESVCHSFSIWCPLTDVAEDNGVMQFYRGSHQRYNLVRGKDIPFQWKEEQQAIIDTKMESVPVRAGDAVLLHHRVIHRSLPNLSTEPRIVAMLAMIPSELSVQQFFLENGEVTSMSREDDFYVHYQVEGYG